MKIDDAIQYWKEEYSKPHTCNSVCMHKWQTDEKKFIYSIRHLYGLEGSHRNYKSPNCTVMCVCISLMFYILLQTILGEIIFVNMFYIFVSILDTSSRTHI